MESAVTPDDADDGWPWNCPRCGVTLYHDATVCRECEPLVGTSTSRSERGRRHLPASFAAWMRRQSYPEFVTQVTAIAGVELLLTALWLNVLFLGTVPAPPLTV